MKNLLRYPIGLKSINAPAFALSHIFRGKTLRRSRLSQAPPGCPDGNRFPVLSPSRSAAADHPTSFIAFGGGIAGCRWHF
jgi:hypothetical protein